MGRVGELDGLRGVAVLLVLTCHAKLALFGPAGSAGVAVFLVLSGYLITGLLVREIDAGGIDLRAFWIRRAARLLPALLLMLAVTVPLLLAVGPFDTRTVLLSAGSAVLYVANLTAAAGSTAAPFSHAWTLSLEEQFYVVWPLLLPALLLARRRPLVILLLLSAGGSLLFRFWVGVAVDLDVGKYHPAGGIGPLLVGAALALRPMTARWWQPPVGVGLLLVAALGVGWLGTVTAFLPATAAAVLLITSRPVWLSGRVLRWVGLRSYAIYLWHVPLLYLPPMVESGWPWRGLVAGALAAVLAAVSWRWVESPAIAWGRSRSARRDPASRTGPAVSTTAESGPPGDG